MPDIQVEHRYSTHSKVSILQHIYSIAFECLTGKHCVVFVGANSIPKS